jgi:hypothetical protein
MKQDTFYAVSKDDSFEEPVFAFGEKLALMLAERLGWEYWAQVKIDRNGAFEYYNADHV